MWFSALDGFIWLAACAIPFWFAQRWLHRELQGVLVLLTRREEIGLAIYALLFFPGVLLHESSHFLAARLLRVRTGKFSLIPRLLPSGRLQLGYVETEKSDLFRDAMIGAAPLFTGGAAMLWLGGQPLGLGPLAGLLSAGDWAALWQALINLPRLPDFWLWFYLAFTISATMLPSASDRYAWLPVILLTAALLGAALLAGAGNWLQTWLLPLVNRACGSLAVAFGVSLALHAVLLLPVGLLRRLLCHWLGVELAYET